MTFLTPARRRGVELLDDPAVAPALRARSLRDVARSNRLLGGRRAARLAMDTLLGIVGSDLPPAVTLLDVGTGSADLPAVMVALGRRHGVRIITVGLDAAPSLARAARGEVDFALAGDALRLPFPDGAVDFVLCSQLLHHFPRAEAERLVAELDRVARVGVVIADLRRSWIAAAGFWLVSFILGFHRVTRHDGVVSVLRGFTGTELAELVRAATGRAPDVHRRLGWRLTVAWRRVTR